MAAQASIYSSNPLGFQQGRSSPATFTELDLGFLSSFVDDLNPAQSQPRFGSPGLAQATVCNSFSQPVAPIDTCFQLPQEDLPDFPLASFQPEFVQQTVYGRPQLQRRSLQAAAQHGRSSSRSSNEGPHSPPDEKPPNGLSSLLQSESNFDYLCNSLPGAELPDQDQDHPDDIEKARAKNRNAQKKFRARQKEKMKDSQRQLEEMSKRMAKLVQEKAELQSRNRILEHVVRLNVDHVEELASNQEVCKIEQEMLVSEFWHWFVRSGQNISLEATKAITVDDYATKGFPAYIMRLRDLLKQGPQVAAAARELKHMVLIRRDQENRAALFSFWNGAILGYNLHKGEGMAPPPLSHWAQILAQLGLTEMQQGKMVDARRRLLTRLKGIAEKRRQIVSSLGLELLSCTREQLHSCRAAHALRENLNEEREAVFDFLFTVGDEVMTPKQEALLDIHSLPWWPDVWQMSALLVQSQQARSMPDERSLGELTSSSPALVSLMPSLTAFQALTRPMLALGMGFQLKRGIVMCPFRTCSPAVAFPIPPLLKVAPMGLFDIMCGKYRPQSFAEWLQQYQRLVAFAENEENPGLAYRAIVFSNLSSQPAARQEVVAESTSNPPILGLKPGP
ncbi:hypothetical protein WJX74_001874 [Apatococcus lobatus]|uniref:BZIP domain-containing protein n=2 Tax=Apatococcus TaxID=904362 RepID=A0AAW1SSG6_9CHLO